MRWKARSQVVRLSIILTKRGIAVNVLITSSGRRISLLQAFKVATEKRGGKVYAGDIDSLAPTLFFADEAIRLAPIRSTEYIDQLLRVVRDHSIHIIVPTIDTELPVLAENVARFQEIGCLPLISAPYLIKVCGDKASTIQVFSEAGFEVPRSWLPEQLPPFDQLPTTLYIKPREGSASRHVYKIHRDHLSSFIQIVPNPIIQEELKGKEITVDALLDLQGRPLHYVPRFRIKTVGGESVEGVTIALSDRQHEWIIGLLRAVGIMGGAGPMTIQVFVEREEMTLSEINPRFGGGFPLGFAAGANYPEWIMEMAEGKTLEPKLGCYEAGVFMSRYNTEIITREPLW